MEGEHPLKERNVAIDMEERKKMEEKILTWDGEKPFHRRRVKCCLQKLEYSNSKTVGTK
ncbi:sugar-binding transcriptional regulator [Sesbania bispinosa]|nr:sugar-binding transcriptional regulator [Sesbania bispinosa]